MIACMDLIVVGSPRRDCELSRVGFGRERYSRIDEDMMMVTDLQERHSDLRVSEWEYEGILEFPQEVQMVYMPKLCLRVRHKQTKIEHRCHSG